MKSASLCLLLFAVAGLLFSTAKGDKCHRKKGSCIPGSHTCMGVSRENECRFHSWRCCYPPMRGKRKRREVRHRSHDPSRDYLPRR
ncbi:hypothetical protein BaRGS_00034757 [Batillaria attramentaria]|uniref:Uncharacterized protein n=1 Tax=Batillaria attramentaria TaxID=370345 RepID=A0ABD0JGQ7_9CAEN